MRKTKPPSFGKRDPVVHESIDYQTYKQPGKLNTEIKSHRIIRLPFTLVCLIMASMLLLPEESRAFIGIASDHLLEAAKNWITRPKLD
ncbi:MAG: hypothetical protein RIC18_16075 [Hoeflea sp.]|uniref:hypothetical protein n=1 Tax=Hoeflea sp. TaxID=1940281 RepID=UPI0032ED45BE